MGSVPICLLSIAMQAKSGQSGKFSGVVSAGEAHNVTPGYVAWAARSLVAQDRGSSSWHELSGE